ncbi:MAG: hypothetical protein LH628_01680 [Microcoleus sp. CAN_BIN18]|nr:hypothetical protein [Microcoleus sp. CAN_BIN18]
MVDTPRESDRRKLAATLFRLFPFNPPITFAYFCGNAIRDRTEFMFWVFPKIADRPVITDRSCILYPVGDSWSIG